MNLAMPFAFVTLAFLVGGCGDDSSDDTNLVDAGPLSDAGVRTIDLIGQWTATSHTFTNNADSEQSLDLIANGGDMRMTVLAGGRARTFSSFNEVSDDYDSQLLITGDILRYTTDETPPRIWNWTFSLEGTTLILTEPDQAFDFTLTGADEVSATEHVVYEHD